MDAHSRTIAGLGPAWRLARERRGVTAIEYALIACLMVLVIVGSVSHMGQSVLSLYNDVVTKVTAAIQAHI